MSLSHVILGWLGYEPMTGYDLNSVIDISTQHFWSTSQSQIYRTLSKIEDEGWVTQEVIQQEDRPARKVYHITDSGRAELKSWLGRFHQPDSPRIPWLIQIFFGGLISDEEILSVLEEKVNNLQYRLGKLRGVRAGSVQQFSPDEDMRDVYYWMLTIDYGEAKLQAQLNWIEKVISQIKSKDYQSLKLKHYQHSIQEMDFENEE
jgi:PadR family transcriptional regulator, regulatory protein AphA